MSVKNFLTVRDVPVTLSKTFLARERNERRTNSIRGEEETITIENMYARAQRWEDARRWRKGFELRGMRGRGRRGVEADAHRAPAVNVDYAHP